MAEEFERVVREYQDKIFRLSLAMLGDRAAAEETAQDVLVRVWEGIARFPRGFFAFDLDLRHHPQHLYNGVAAAGDRGGLPR